MADKKRFAVSLPGFRYVRKLKVKGGEDGASELAEVAEVEADDADHAKAVFNRRMGIRATTQDHIVRELRAKERAEDVEAALLADRREGKGKKGTYDAASRAEEARLKRELAEA